MPESDHQQEHRSFVSESLASLTAACVKHPHVVLFLMAATAAVHDLTVVTRNVADIGRTGVRWVDPFTGTTSD